MVGRQLITSPLFQAKGKLSPTLMRNLLVRGGGILVNDLLQRFGVKDGAPVAATVVTLDPGTGQVRGVRFETRGEGPEVSFKASELWSGVTEDIQIKVKLNDLSVLKWLTVGEKRNQTEWLDGESLDLDVVATHQELGILSKAQLEDHNVGGFCARFTLLPVSSSKAFLYGGIVPMAKAELMTKLRDMELEPSSPYIPTVALKLFFTKGKLVNALPLDLVPAERQEDRVGLGVLPLLESIGSSSPAFPAHEDIAEQLANLLRKTNPPNNVNVARIRVMLQASSFPQTTTSSITYEWPEFTRQQSGSSQPEPVTGMSSLFFLSPCH